MAVGRLALLVCALPLLIFLSQLKAEVGAVATDAKAITAHVSYEQAWRDLGASDFEGFMAFCRRRIPRTASLVSIAATPAFGYYRAGYDLDPRTVWPIVSPLGPEANAYPRVTPRLLDATLARTGARYVVVWRVRLTSPWRGYRWLARYATDEYVMAVR